MRVRVRVRGEGEREGEREVRVRVRVSMSLSCATRRRFRPVGCSSKGLMRGEERSGERAERGESQLWVGGQG